MAFFFQFEVAGGEQVCLAPPEIPDHRFVVIFADILTRPDLPGVLDSPN